MAGCTLRAHSSNTRCWYSISVTKRAAWNRRSPAQPLPSTGTLGPPAGVGIVDDGVGVRDRRLERAVGLRLRARVGVVGDVAHERRVEPDDVVRDVAAVGMRRVGEDALDERLVAR